MSTSSSSASKDSLLRFLLSNPDEGMADLELSQTKSFCKSGFDDLLEFFTDRGVPGRANVP